MIPPDPMRIVEVALPTRGEGPFEVAVRAERSGVAADAVLARRLVRGTGEHDLRVRIENPGTWSRLSGLLAHCVRPDGSERNDAALNTIRAQFEEASNRWKEEQARAGLPRES